MLRFVSIKLRLRRRKRTLCHLTANLGHNVPLSK
jgi:hypothetical protein